MVVSMLTGCAYRLPPAVPPTKELLLVRSKLLQHYSVRVEADDTNDYEVPKDGRIAFGVPGYRSPCGVYLFNALKVGGNDDPLKAWRVSILRNQKIVKRLTVRAIIELPTDDAGYHVLTVSD